MGEVVYIRGLPDTTACEIHDWPTEGLGKRLVDAMRASHPRGIDACTACVGRARLDAERFRRAPPRERLLFVSLDRRLQRFLIAAADDETLAWVSSPAVELVVRAWSSDFLAANPKVLAREPRAGESSPAAGVATAALAAASLAVALRGRFPEETVEVRPSVAADDLSGAEPVL